MSEKLKKGDKVKWETSHGETEGKVVRKQTSETKIKDQTVRATKSDPQFVVESDKTGERAAHKPTAIKKV
jgi:hypothetical protein